MSVKKSICLKRANIAKVLVLGCIFLFCFLFSAVKVGALNIDILSSTYTGNGNKSDAVTINGIDYIQGTGVSHQDGITFKLTDIYSDLSDLTSIAVWESNFSEDSQYKDYDRWYLRTTVCDSEDDCGEVWDIAVASDYTVKYLSGDNKGEVIYKDVVGNGKLTRYYIQRSTNNIVSQSGYLETVVDFDKFFNENEEITYTYRIRNFNYLNRADKDGFGYKRVEISLWRASSGGGDVNFSTNVMFFGLAKAIDDVEVYTNYNKNIVLPNTIACDSAAIKDMLCIDYVDTNGDAESSTIVPKATNIFIPDNVLYAHYSTTRGEVEDGYMVDIKDAGGNKIGEKVDLDTVAPLNSLYALNYFCEGDAITLPSFETTPPTCTITGDKLREYLYVEAKLIGDTNIVAQDPDDEVLNTAFRETQYQVEITVDSAGGYMVYVRDRFGNVNSSAIIKVSDILNRSLISHFDKSNKTDTPFASADGWKADEYLTNEDVTVTITMTATTVIEKGLPIIGAETTLLDSSYIKLIQYWRVDGSKYDEDICVPDAQGKFEDSCAARVTSGDSLVTLYNKPIGQEAQKDASFVGFDENRISLNIASNGRYRFYIELYSGNNTNDNKGDTKNPRVEIYKIDKEAPEITFKENYKEGTYTYYQGSGIPSGTTVSNLYNSGSAPYKIAYTKNGIYYVSANGESSLLSSASTSDVFFAYIHSIYNSGANINENIRYYKDTNADISANGGNVLKYSHFAATNNSASDDVEYVIDNDVFKALVNGTLQNMSEEQYREYIIRNNIKYTAFSLANNTDIEFKAGEPTYDYYNMKIEYYDAIESDKKVCEKLAALAIDLNSDETIDKHDCVNYYLDHGLDFIIKITAYDVVQDGEGNYIVGNEHSNTVTVDVEDNTAPGFSSVINNYNIGSECRIEIGGSIGSVGQAKQQLLECYGIYSDEKYHIEDNVFAGGFTQTQTVNTVGHVSLYMLNRSNGEWVSFEDTTGYEPDRSGKYAILAIIRDDASGVSTTFDLKGNTYHDVVVSKDKASGDSNAITVDGNAIATVFTYYVDKRIVLISPVGGVYKDYGEADPLFNYTVLINKNNTGIASYLAAPFKDMTVFSEVGTTENVSGVITLTEAELKSLFKSNYGKAVFTGAITRQESALYNGYHDNYDDNSPNNYVGEYKLVLGTLDIANSITNTDEYDLGEDYIIKINPNVRNDEYQLVGVDNSRRVNGAKKPNLVLSMMYEGVEVTDTYPYTNGGCYNFEDDDDFFVESTEIFTIRQVILTVRANGSSKEYGSVDTNHTAANLNANVASSVVNAEGLASNNITTAYLNGYKIEGLKYSDTAKVVLGVLRREVGEDVGIYSICNYRGTGKLDTELETYNNMLVVGSSTSGVYQPCSTFDALANTSLNTGNYVKGIIDLGSDGNDFIKSRSLYIAPNVIDGFYKVLNSVKATVVRDNNYSNYLISYVESQFEIKAATMVIQPTPGQRREYSYAGVDEVNPWEVVVYGEKSFTQTPASGAYNGYTANSPIYTASENDPKSVDTDNPVEGQESYNNASEAKSRNPWTLILDGVTYTGKATNETYSLLDGRLGLAGKTPTQDGVYTNMAAGWYEYNSTLSIIGNDRNQCATNNGADVDGTNECRNYNLVMDYDYRDVDGDTKVDDGDGNEIDIVYKSKLGYCKDTILGTTSDSDIQCDASVSGKILFEVYRREIILEFNSLLEKIPYNNADIVYGYRYDYYFVNLLNIAANSNNKDYLENSLFYCYASYKEGIVGTSGDCTTNEWYGLTKNDSWVNVGLTFKLHSVVSATTSNYYDTATDYAIPAGRYYVYASISETAENNYKFNYLGGTLTIKTKTTGITLTSYSKEYGDVYYTDSTCLRDYSFLSKEEALITDCGSDVDNTSSNTYGFVVNGLDSKDTIADNFKGRPYRVSNLGLSGASGSDTYGLQENVGVYGINQGNIYSINNNSFTKCTDPHMSNSPDCVVVEGININNYMMVNDASYELNYYLLKNGTVANEKNYYSKAEKTIVNDAARTVNTDATLTITPATITITVSPDQTKMYGCAYNSYNTTSLYSYSYAAGYDCIESTGSNYDLGYKYTVSGDKDYYIYNKGYYTSNFASLEDKDLAYTSDAINQVSRSSVIASLLLEGSVGIGLRSSALNGGVLYRSGNSAVTLASIVSAADNAQAMTHYQGQSVGSYYITLGNLDATLANLLPNYVEANNKVCDSSNTPGAGNSDCKNYIISYYGNTSVQANHNYSSASDTVFTITPRVAFIYAEYNSKVYGQEDPDLSKTCTQDMIDAKLCSVLNSKVEYGVGYYYTKANSLAKKPWVASIDTADSISFENTTSVRDDVQTDVASGKLSRVGMNNNDKTVDDIVGTYNYLFENNVKTTTYSSTNYVLNYHYRTLSDGFVVIKDGKVSETDNPIIYDDFGAYKEAQAVNANGGNSEVVEGITKEVLFEINLRKITVTLISFDKVYGIEDNSYYYDLGICATGDENLIYDDKGNPLCEFVEGVTSSEHGLSPSHKRDYMNADGTLKQTEFKTDFEVSFVRAKGENVAASSYCGPVSGTINGYFPDEATVYEYDLGCSANGYEALGIINQADNSQLGYNYEITYVEGTMNVIARQIQVTPESGQGFQYGSYTNPSLIPAIKFSNALDRTSYHSGTKKTVAYSLVGEDLLVTITNRDRSVTNTNHAMNDIGLVNGGEDGKICLTNIDKTNTFCIDDRQNIYVNNDTEMTVSNTGFVMNENGGENVKATYVFGDVYLDESSSRSALNRKLSSSENERYNRNVGTYTITQGDLDDKSGNYVIDFTDGVSYVITPASIKITPDAGQSKIYGQSDKELTFKVQTTYTVNTDQYVIYHSSIYSINGEIVTAADATNGKIKVEKDDVIVLNGYAYYENSLDSENNIITDYNYGRIKNSNKGLNGSAVTQLASKVGKSYDKYCYDNYTDNSDNLVGTINGCSEQNVQFAASQLVLIGYLYVEGYNQKAGTHTIVNGFIVANNEFNNDNYVIEFVNDVTFEIIKLDINLIMKDITKTYGQATDTNKCETGADCSGGFATLSAQDNENTLEYNFDIKYKDGTSIINPVDNMVLMVNAINDNYYTQSETREDKNNFLGISVIRLVKEEDGDGNKIACSINTDKYGCEDVGTYKLVFRKISVIKEEKDGSTRYDDNYNLMIDNTNATFTEFDSADYVTVNAVTHELEEVEKVNIVDDIEGSLTITKRVVDIYVNTNLNTNENNYYQIEQNVEVPSLPLIRNDYDLKGYEYDASKPYHNHEDPASTSDNTDPALNTTYTKIVWGNQPDQVRTGDGLVGQVAYCNEALDGSKYMSIYPGGDTLCTSYSANLVYETEKASVNTNTKDKFIVITRDVASDKGLKIRSAGASNVANNDYEDKNYTVSFYPGAVNVVADSAVPVLVVGNKDYYIEANARSGASANGDSVGTILEYLFNGTDTNYILAGVDSDGNLFIDVDSQKIIISQGSLSLAYGIDSDGYKGIVSGVEQSEVYPFVSDYAHVTSGNNSYLNETNIKTLQELITTLIKWFNVTSYDAGQIINGQYLPRKFDKYYYVAINKYGTDISNEVNNEFAINKVGTYDLRFYVMDNAGKISNDYNTGRLHIIDTTAPSGGELTLYNAAVKCDENCNEKESWYIQDASIRLNSFNRYNEIDDGEGNKSYVLDAAGTHILFGKLGTQNVYISLEELRAETGRITTIDYVDYINTGDDKYSALGIEHYSWTSNPSGVYLTVTGGSDNSYTNLANSNDSQWQYYYSVDGGVYWLNYEMVNGMSGYSALVSDGTRVVKVMTMDMGVNKIVANEIKSINFEVTYQGGAAVEVINKVIIDSVQYTFAESDVSERYFEYDMDTTCVINKKGTLITCTTRNDAIEDDVTKVKLEGNRFTYRENNYLIANDYILTEAGSAHTKLIGENVVINGVTYRFDRSAMVLYRDYIGVLASDVVTKDSDGNIISSYTPMTLNGVNYMITVDDVGGVATKMLKLLSTGASVTSINDDSFILDGRLYTYYEDAYLLYGYYKHTASYTIVNDTFKVDGTVYSTDVFDSNDRFNVVVSGVNKGTLKLSEHVTYSTTYKLYDRYLIGLSNLYADNAAVAYDETILLFRQRLLINNVNWNTASTDSGSVNEEVAAYLNISDDSKKVIYKDQKVAYLDTTAPQIGLNITNEISSGVYENVNYGDDWYVFEYGYYNTMALSNAKTYYLNGVTYEIDINNLLVSGDDDNEYVIRETGAEDPNKKYVYEIEFTNFYIDEGITTIQWVYSYVENYAGGKDLASGKDVSNSESKYYNLNSSVFGGKVFEDTLGEYDLIKSNTRVDVNAGISGDKYKTTGTTTLFDLVDIGTRSDGIYYEDIDYIVWYYDEDNNVVSVELDDEFKACYDNYDGEGNKRVTAECAQDAIEAVVNPEGLTGDIVYTINYVIRDKAGNASTYAARGILYASILPGTKVIINQVEPTPANSGVSVVDLGNNTYEMNANQGVSLDLLAEAFNVNYSTYKKNYNKSAVMTIYKGEEVLIENAKGVNFTDYIDSSQIGEYTIVYNMKGNYVTGLGQRIPVEGEQVVLHLNVLAPKLDIESDIEIEIDTLVKNDTNIIFVFMILGFIAIASMGVIIFIKKKR